MSPPPRTLAVLHLAEPSGPSRDLELHLGGLAEDGLLDVVVPGPGRVADSLRRRARVTELDYAALTMPRGAAALARAPGRLRAEAETIGASLRAANPDVVVVATTTLPAALLAARRERVPALLYATEVIAGRAAVRSLPGAAAARALLSLDRALASGIVACSEAVARQFGRGGGVSIVYPPIEDPGSRGDGGAFRARHGIDPGEPCVVVVGNVTRGRGQDVMIRALRGVRDAIPGTRCAIVGDPFPRGQDLAFREELAGLAERTGVSDAIRFTGYCERIADAYAAADVVVNPTRTPESFGRAACEALVAGRPVVSSRGGAVPEVLRDGETALLVEPEQPDALAAAVVRVLGDRAYAERIAAAGRRDVLDRFAAERGRSSFMSELSRVAG